MRQAHPDGFDFEKTRYIPGIFDSVELICSGTPQVVNVQAIPDVAGRLVRVQALVRNAGPEVKASLRFIVREAKNCKVAGEAVSPAENLGMGAERTLQVSIPIANCRYWSPEDPFLYEITTDSGADILRTRFGMREFKFDPATGRALLNGKPYYMRGSNMTLYRFFEDSECGKLPWDEKWVRLLHRRVKDMGWNCLRYCIGFPPEACMTLPTRLAFSLTTSFRFGLGATCRRNGRPRNWPKRYTEWLRERWNHPCVVIWDACNETRSPKTGDAFKQIRAMDLSNRPWDNGYTPPQEPGDMLEEHPYHFWDAHFRLANLATSNPQAGDGHHAVVINEYGWLWLNRDGTPTTLTSQLYRNLLGEDSTTEQRRHLYATYTAAETEFWRHGRQAAAVMHFTTLGYSRPDGQTSDHWLNVKKLEWEPEFVKYVRDAFAPVGVMIDAWGEEYPASHSHEFPVSVINDQYEDWQGSVRFRLAHDGKVVQEKTQSCEVAALGKTRLSFRTDIPRQPGRYELEAALVRRGMSPVRSVREFLVLTAEEIKEKRAREGLAYLKTATASSVYGAAYAAANAVDGNPATYWSSTFADPAWLAVDLGAVCKFSHVLIVWETAYSKAFVLQASRDGQSWTDIHTESNCQGGTSEIRFSPIEARHVQFTEPGAPPNGAMPFASLRFSSEDGLFYDAEQAPITGCELEFQDSLAVQALTAHP